MKFDIIPSRFEETLDKSAFKHPYEYVLENSKQKALEVAGRIDKVSVSCMYKMISIFIERLFHIISEQTGYRSQKPVSIKRRLQDGGKVQTEFKMQTAHF